MEIKIIYCIIVTFNAERYIRRCLDNLIGSSYPINIIIVDNFSTDGTVPIIEKEYSGNVLFKLKENLGFGKANNLGIKYAYDNNADYILLINQDVYLEKETLRELVGAAEAEPKFGVLSPMHLNSSGQALDYHFFTFIQSNWMYWSDVSMKNKTARAIYPCGFLNAAAWLLSRNCISSVGGFDPLFFHYGEDNDYINRVLFKGINVGFCPNAKMIHDRGEFNQLAHQPSYNRELLYVKINLKDLNHRGSVIVKAIFVDFLTDIFIGMLSWEPKKITMVLRLMVKTCTLLKSVKKSRSVSKSDFSYLNDLSPYTEENPC